MKEVVLDWHSKGCEEHTKNGSYVLSECHTRPNRLIFYLKGKFILLTFFTCNLGYTKEFDYVKEILEEVIPDNKIFSIYEVNKSVKVEDELRDFRIRNKNLRKVVQEVNFIYGSSVQYAVTTKVAFIDTICDFEKITIEYELAKDFLIKNEYNSLIHQLDLLYNLNRFYVSPILIVKTTDHLIAEINKIIT